MSTTSTYPPTLPTLRFLEFLEFVLMDFGGILRNFKKFMEILRV